MKKNVNNAFIKFSSLTIVLSKRRKMFIFILLLHITQRIHAFLYQRFDSKEQPSKPTVIAIQAANMNSNENNQGFGVTSTVISQLAVTALKLRLAESSSVICDVSTSSSKLLLEGKVGPIVVKGKRWASPMGLTCRAIEASVPTCYLDVAAIVSRRKLVLTEPAKGDAMVAFNAHDFGNFITHPLLIPPQGSGGTTIRFVRDGVKIVPDTLHGGVTSMGYVLFNCTCFNTTWTCRLQRAGTNQDANQNHRVQVDVEPTIITTTKGIHSEEHASQLGSLLTNFFDTLVFNLDGTFLTIKDLMVNGKGSVPTILLALHITVKKFPSYRLKV